MTRSPLPREPPRLSIRPILPSLCVEQIARLMYVQQSQDLDETHETTASGG